MTIPEEIEQLKVKLENIADEREQAEVILKILDKYAFLRSNEGESYIEQLKQTAGALKNDEYYAWVYYYTAINHVYGANYSVAIEIIEKAIKLFSALNHRYGLALAYNTMGLNYFNQHNYPLAMEYYLNTANVALEAGEKNILSRAYNNIGNIYYQQGDYPVALEHHFKALTIREEAGDKTPLASSYANIGNVYASQSNYAPAIEYYSKAIQIRETTEDKSGLSVVYNNIGSICMYQGDYPKALEYILKGLKLREEAGDKKSLSDSYGSIGNIYILLGNYPLAFEYFSKALKCREETDDKKGLAHCYVNLGDYYFKVKEYDKGTIYLKDALRMFEDIGVKEGKREALQLLYELNKAKGDATTALDYYEQCVILEKELNNIETAQKIAAMHLSREMEQKEKAMETERLHHTELKAEKERAESLLLNILPAEVAEELKQKGTAQAKHFDDVTVLFSDFTSFTTVSERLSPQQLVDELHACFSAFDEIIGKHNIEKIKTVGDAYLAVCGLPLADEKHAENILKAAIEIRNFMFGRRKELGENTFEIRIGIHSGSVVAGIVGVKKFAYDIWGDTVNTAARMEQNSEAGKINISQTTYELLKDSIAQSDGISFIYRGEIDAKNKGKMKMYFVD